MVNVRFRSVLFFFISLCSLFSVDALRGQPLVESERTIVEGTRWGQELIDREEYLSAIELLGNLIDSAAPGADISTPLFLLVGSEPKVERNYPALDAARRFLLLYPNDPRAGEVRYSRGVVAWRERKYAEATEAFRTIVRLKDGREAEAYYWLGRMAAERGAIDTAELLIARSLEEGPHDYTDDALYLSAWIKEDQGGYRQAADLYRRIVDEYPESDLRVDAQLRLGVNQARNGYHESALTLFASLSPASDRQQEELLFYSAESNASLGRHERAVEIYNDFLRSFPHSHRVRSVRYSLGWSQLQLRRHDAALATFRTLSSGSDSLAAAALYQIGAIDLTRGDTVSALASLKELVDRLPYESFSDNAYYELGKIYYRRGQWDTARRYLIVTARQFPSSDVRVEAFHDLGEAYAVLREYDNAIYSFSRVRKLGDSASPLVAHATWREGMLLYRVGRFTSAIDRLRMYVANYPDGEDMPLAAFWLAESLYQDGNYNEAAQFYAQVIEEYPGSRYHAESMYGLGWAQYRQKDFRAAIASYQKFIDAYPEQPEMVEASIRMADAYRFLREYDRAIAIYQSVGNRAGAGAAAEEARVRLAEAFVEMGEYADAVEVYEELVRRYPKSERIDDYDWAVGATWFRGGSDSLAIVELERFLQTYERSDNRANAQLMLGESWYNLGYYETALEWYRRVLDENPESPVVPTAMEGVRFSLESMGRGPEAIGIIEEFERVNPSRLAADSLAFRKGMIYFDNGAYDQADSLFRELIREFPESGLLAASAYQIGKGREYRGDFAGAIAAYEGVVRTYPSSDATALALVDMGELKLFRNDYGGARDNFLLLVERFPESAFNNQARYGAGRASLMIGDTAIAEMLFRRVIDSATGLGSDLFIDRSRIALADVYYARDSVDVALDLLASVVARRRDYTAAEALLRRGQILAAVNDLSAALAELRRLTEEFTDYPEYVEPGLLELGLLYENLTDKASALAAYRKLLEISEDEELREQAEERVRGIEN